MSRTYDYDDDGDVADSVDGDALTPTPRARPTEKPHLAPTPENTRRSVETNIAPGDADSPPVTALPKDYSHYSLLTLSTHESDMKRNIKKNMNAGGRPGE